MSLESKLDGLLLYTLLEKQMADDKSQYKTEVDVFLSYTGDFTPFTAMGFKIQSPMHRLASGTVSPTKLISLAKQENVIRIEKINGVFLHLDHDIPEIHGDTVRLGNPPPPYTGAGVIVGIIDTGLYVYQHGLQDNSNQTRVLSFGISQL